MKKIEEIKNLKGYKIPELFQRDPNTDEKIILREERVILANPVAVKGNPEAVPVGAEELSGKVYLVEDEDGTRRQVHESQMKVETLEAPKAPAAEVIERQPGPSQTFDLLDVPAPLVTPVPSEPPVPTTEKKAQKEAPAVKAEKAGDKSADA